MKSNINPGRTFWSFAQSLLVQAFTMTIENGECIFHMNHSDDDRMQKWFQIHRELGKEIVKQLQKGSAGSRL